MSSKRKKKSKDKRKSVEPDLLGEDGEANMLSMALERLAIEDNEDEEPYTGFVELEVVGSAASSKRDHVQRNRVLLHPRNMRRIGVPAGGYVLVEDFMGDGSPVMATCWPFDSMDLQQVQLSQTLFMLRGPGKILIRHVDPALVKPCRTVSVYVKGRDSWSNEAARLTVKERHVPFYIKQVLLLQSVRPGSVFGLLLNGYFCSLIVANMELELMDDDDSMVSAVGLVDDKTHIDILLNPDDNDGNGNANGKQTQTVMSTVGGHEKERAEVMEIVNAVFQSRGEKTKFRIPRGILLFGPPGTGKTLIARSVANELGVRVHVLNGAEIVGKFVGQAESRLNDIFERAISEQPALVFIDEIDSLCPSRTESENDQTHIRLVTLLLQRMDDLHRKHDAVAVIAATNRPSALDIALRRPGRFDRELEIGIPGESDREQILRIHLGSVPHNITNDQDIKELASSLHGFVGADIMALCREAAWRSLRREIDGESSVVTLEDLIGAKSTVRPSALRELAIEVPHVSWDDVGGQEDIKRKLKEAVEWPLKHPEAFQRMGINPPQGVLLYGPPGCSKTLLAKAIATEGQMNFIAVKGPELFSKWVGESEKAVREVFRKARMSEPTVIFFDEIDALASARKSEGGGVSDRVLSQLLVEMDGMEARKRVVVVAATNRPDILDTALIRPGRLDRLIYVPPPDEKARKEILRIHTKNMALQNDVDLDEISSNGFTGGWSGAEVASLCREAAVTALQEDYNITAVGRKHFVLAKQSITPQITPDMIAFYENMKLTGK